MLVCENLHIKQGNFEIKNINFSIERGQYVVLMGKTGSGKSSIIENICGLRKLYKGNIYINGDIVNHYPPSARQIGYVPQDGALFTHMTVFKNIGFALKIRKFSDEAIKKKVYHLAELMHIQNLLDKNPTKLSGGEKQRVALARALSFQPKILCLDEPLTALDEATKNQMYILLKNLKKTLYLTVLHISHSTQEANVLADKIFKIEKERLIV